MKRQPNLTFEPLGDQAVLIHCANEAQAAALADSCQTLQPPWRTDLVLAYQSVAVYCNLAEVGYHNLVQIIRQLPLSSKPRRGWHVEIPCCYELGPDLEAVAQHLGLMPPQVIVWHTRQSYTVFAIGFSPGFPYLGYLPERLCGLRRLAQPRIRVEPGSVGITGRQTAIYPNATPGGWQLIGRTPLEIVNVADGYFPLRVGDTVKFIPIDCEEFERRNGERLPPRAEGPA